MMSLGVACDLMETDGDINIVWVAVVFTLAGGWDHLDNRLCTDLDL